MLKCIFYSSFESSDVSQFPQKILSSTPDFWRIFFFSLSFSVSLFDCSSDYGGVWGAPSCSQHTDEYRLFSLDFYSVISLCFVVAVQMSELWIFNRELSNKCYHLCYSYLHLFLCAFYVCKV